jgi:hypothetical protein
MTKKEHDVQSKSKQDSHQVSLRRKLAIFISSWTIVFILGVSLCLAILWLIGQFTIGSFQGQSVAGKILVIYGLFASIVLTLIYILFRHPKSRFIRYSKWATLGGLGINILILILGIAMLGGINAQNKCTTLSDQFFKAQNSIVPIETNLGRGTGFTVRDDSTVLTAYHVIEGASEVYANYVNERVVLKLLATAPDADLALLSMAKPTTGHMDITEVYHVSDELYAYGYPGNTFEAGQASLSKGILSRVITNDDIKLNNQGAAPEGLEMIQTDMALNAGNSGGPIFNECGVIGVVSMKSNTQQLAGAASEEGINYGISSKTVLARLGLGKKN